MVDLVAPPPPRPQPAHDDTAVYISGETTKRSITDAQVGVHSFKTLDIKVGELIQPLPLFSHLS